MTDKPKILIVEDEAAIWEPLEEALQREGFTTEVATTGGEGLAAVDGGSSDLVLLDLMLPDRDGRDVCREIRRL